MMKYLVTGLVIAVAAFVAPQLDAAELKIGVVNMRALMAESPLTADVQKRIQDEFAPQQRELEKQQNDLKSLQDKLQRDGETMSSSELQQLQRRMRDLERDLQRNRQQAMEDFRLRQNEELQGLQAKLLQQVQRFGDSQGYDLILVDGVAYASEAVDVTAAVLAQMKGE
jgi:outer membrane protein